MSLRFVRFTVTSLTLALSLSFGVSRSGNASPELTMNTDSTYQQIVTAQGNRINVFVEPVPDATGLSSQETVEPVSAEIPDVFTLHSDAESDNIIYLDFDGILWTPDSGWYGAYGVDFENRFSPGYDLDGDPATFNEAERQSIFSVWQAVSEDFAVFDVDVTTERPVGDRLQDFMAKGAVALILSDTELQEGCMCGGVAGVDIFSRPNPFSLPSLNFMKFGNYNPPAWDVAEIVSHEVGHNLGLMHDGTSQLEYYFGNTAWTPIMGAGRGAGIATWSDGDYPDAVTRGFQAFNDDYATINRHLPLRVDSIGDSIAQATPVDLSGYVLLNELIETPDDVDVFEIETQDSGSLKIAAESLGYAPNLDIELKLFSANGALITSSNPLIEIKNHFGVVRDGLQAYIETEVPAGTYYIQIDGVGQGTPLQGVGYSDYGSVGRYQLIIQTSEPFVSSLSTYEGGAGTAVEIVGANIPQGSAVFFGQTEADSVAWIDSTQLIVGVPDISAFTTLTIRFGGVVIAQSPTNFDSRFVAVQPGLISSDKSAYRLNEKILISGTNVGAARSVLIGEAEVDFSVTGISSLEVTVQANFASSEIEVVTAGGSRSTGEITVFRLAPLITGLSKTNVKVGDILVVSGNHFSSVTSVRLAGKNLAVVSKLDNSLSVRIPIAKSGRLAIENAFGETITNQTIIVSGTSPVITKASVKTARLGSTVMLTGKNFVKGVKVFIGSTAVSNLKLLSESKLSFKVPAAAKSGFVSVRTFVGTAKSKSILRIVR
jgi:hypothetical protein